MTDQDPTQAYEPPPTPPAPPAEPPAVEPPVAFAPSEPPVAAAPVAPVATAPSGGRPGRSKLKWLVAGVITLLVVGTAAGATLMLTGDSGDPAVLTYTPADSTAYTELRLDLPGDQAAELAAVMKAFPGFQDQAAFPVKLDEILDQLVGSGTDGQQSYTRDIKPWFGGQVGASVGPLPTSVDASAARGLVLLGVTDAGKAQAWMDGVVAKDGASSSTEDYKGVTITIVEPKGDVAAMVEGATGAYAVLGPVMAIGDEGSVKAAIDTGGKTGLNTDKQFQEAEASVTGDRLGFAYADLEALVKGVEGLADDAASLPALPASLGDLTPPWVAGAVRAQDGAFVMESRSPRVEGAIGPTANAESKLPGLLPPTTVFLAEGHDVGATLTQVKTKLAEVPELQDPIKQLDEALAIVGGWDALTAWMGEVGIAVSIDGSDVGGGLVVAPADAAAAEKLFGQLEAFIALGGAQAGLTITSEDYNGATIKVVDLAGLGGLVGAMSEGAVEAPADLKLAYTVTDDVVVIAIGTDFVKGVLDARAGESLADTERFKTALEQAGTQHTALVWLDVAATRGFIEGLVPSDMRGEYDASYKPYLEAFDSVIGTTSVGETIDAGTLIIHVKGG